MIKTPYYLVDLITPMMSLQEEKKISKLLSYVLRHHPELIRLELDSRGWAEIDQLLRKMNEAGHHIDRSMLEQVVGNNSKKRFRISEDGKRIRASQGHSIAIELDYTPLPPPEVLYHGTAVVHADAIKANGLRKMQRHHVHLSADEHTAKEVGGRHGRPIVFCVNAGDMVRDGYLFYRSDNGVWLTEEVPAKYLFMLRAGD